MGAFAGVMMLIPLVILVLAFLVFIPLPIYIGGKIAHVQHEKFSYKSCIWTGFAGGICAGILAGLLNAGLSSFVTGSAYETVSAIVSLIVSIVVFGYFFKKHYLMTNGQVAITYISMLVFNIIVGVVLFFVLMFLGIGALDLLSA